MPTGVGWLGRDWIRTNARSKHADPHALQVADFMRDVSRFEHGSGR